MSAKTQEFIEKNNLDFLHKNDYLSLQYNVLEVHIWYNAFENIFHFFKNLFLKIQSYFFPIIAKEESPKLSITDIYIEKQTKLFVSTYDIPDSDKKMNMNMDSEFYDIEKYKNTILAENNDFETKWKNRILYEYTPRGNITMFYDVFKKGFSYYSDQQSIPYNILNAVAMKYVRIFSCRDLFVDDKIIPEAHPSPLLKIKELEEKNEKSKIKEEYQKNGIDKDVLNKAPFAKFKKYNSEDKNKNNKNNKNKNNNQEKENGNGNDKNKIYNMNKFIFLGKSINFSFIQKIEKKNKKIIFENSKFSSIFEKEHDLQKEVLSYRDFKNKSLQKI
jgi:hypothetical protein